MSDESFEMDMSKEKSVRRRKLIPVGWRHLKFTSAENRKSKAGNPMVVIETLDVESGLSNEEYFVTEPGKRWKLKNLLNSIGVEGGQDGNYKWRLSDIIGKEADGLSEHEPNEYIDREGNKKIQTQSVINEFRTRAWDEGQ